MNLIFRVLWVILYSFFRPKIDHVLSPSRLTLRVWPNDLDTNWHMNNGRYLTIMDLGRFDLILRTGLLQLMLKQKSVPILAAATIRYRLPLDPWQKFHLDTRVVCWDDKWVIMEQRFIHADGPKAGAVAAIGLVKGSFWDKANKTTVPTQKLLDILGITDHSPPFPPEVAAWLAAEDSLKGVTDREKNGKTQ
jgi:acyl-CoA thioesterase FadM